MIIFISALRELLSRLIPKIFVRLVQYDLILFSEIFGNIPSMLLAVDRP